MKYKFEIEREGKLEQASVEPVVYQDRHMYEIGINGNFTAIYHNGEEWKLEKDEDLDQGTFKKIVELIENKIEKSQAKQNS